MQPVMGMGGTGGRRNENRRRLVAWVVVIALVLSGAAVLISMLTA